MAQPSPRRPVTPPSPEHQRLLALQRAAGNHAVAQLAGPAAASPAGTKAKAAVTPEELAALSGSIAKAAHDVVGTPAAADLFRVIADQVKRTSPKATAPKHKADDPLTDVYTELYSAETRGVLARLQQSQRGQLLNSLLDALIPALGGGDNPVHAPDTATDNATAAAADAPLVSSRIKANCEGGWAAVRRTLLATFGVLEVGPEKAIERANAFYAQLVPSTLLGTSGSLVHPDMQAALDRASSWLTAQKGVDLDAVRAAAGHPSGFNIRANRNNPLALSEHSFGFAIDLKAALNPNIGKSGALDPVADATGVDPRAISTSGRDAAGVQGAATTLYQASSDYVATMSEPARFTTRVRQIVDGVRAGEKLPGLDDAAVTALSELLRTGATTPADDRILAAAFPAGATTSVRMGAVASLKRLAKAWRSANPAKGKRPAASVTASVGSVAANGFLSLPPTLTAALSGSDAGGLTWLGTSSVHDFMHFELPHAARPPLF